MKHIRYLLVMVVVGAAGLASAQGPGWLADRTRAEGPGFRVGNFELHPGFGAEAGYDSNVFYRDAGSLRDRVGSAIFRFTPHFFVTNLGEQRTEEGESRGDGESGRMVELTAGASAEAYIYLEDDVPNNIAVNGDLDLNINPNGRFGFRIFDKLSRTVRPFTNNLDTGDRNHAQIGNTAGAQIFLRSAGGLLQTSMGYSLRLSFFEGNAFQYANRLNHQISADTHYKFLPNTSLFWDATFDYTTFPETGGALTLADNWRVRTRVGLNGAITPKLSATAAIGYTATFVQDDRFSDFDSVIALAGLKIRLTPTVSLGLGYERENQGSVVGLYRVQDRGYLDFQWLLGRSFILGFNAWVAYLNFGDVLDAAGMSLGDRTDVMVSASLFAEYRFTDWLALNATVGYTGDYTDFEYQADVGMGAFPEPAGFNKFEAWLGLRVFY